MNPDIVITIPAVLAVAMLVVLYVRTFGRSRKVAKPVAIAGEPDASGRTLQQRLDQSEASFR